MHGHLLDPLLALAFSAARLSAFFVVFVLLDSGNLKGVVRTAVILALATVVAPLVYREMPGQLPLGSTLLILAKEAFIGGLLGFAANQLLWVMQTVGALIDQQTGVGTASMIDPVNIDQAGPTPGFLNTVFVNVLLASGAFLGLLGAVFDTYKLWPVFSYWPRVDERLVWLASGQARTLFELTVKIASPVILLLLVVELGLGLMQRYLTTLNVFYLSQCLKILLALLVLAIIITSSWEMLLGMLDPARAVQRVGRVLFGAGG